MSEIFFRMGRVKSVVLITFSAVVASVLLTSTVFIVLGKPMPRVNLGLSIFAPLMIASLWSWRTIGLIFKIHELEARMRRLAHYDALTSVMSRLAFLEASERLLQLTRRGRRSLSVVYLDIDDFKHINDAHGHACGDRVLRSIGAILASALRHSDVVGRLGGEEFAFVLPDTPIDGARVFAERIRALVQADEVACASVGLRYTVSVGVAAAVPDAALSLEAIISRADGALYKAKRAGKDRVVVHGE